MTLECSERLEGVRIYRGRGTRLRWRGLEAAHGDEERQRGGGKASELTRAL